MKTNTLNKQAYASYLNRYADIFPQAFLKGKKIIFYEHSSVARDIIPGLLSYFGAEIIKTGRSDVFVPIDTENVTEDQKKFFRKTTGQFKDCFALISTDGDGDRPFVIDEKGEFIRGDVLGNICRSVIKPDHVSLPITSNSAIIGSIDKDNIHRELTRIGSPHVISSMRNAVSEGFERVVGWEVNGGFLSATDLDLEHINKGAALSALPTRDSGLPILCALYKAVSENKTLSDIHINSPQLASQSGLLDNFDQEKTKIILNYFKPSFLEDIMEIDLMHPETLNNVSHDLIEKTKNKFSNIFSLYGLNGLEKINYLDGIRFYFKDNEILHLRPSGNSPQFRAYALASEQARADKIINDTLFSEKSLINAVLPAVSKADKRSTSGEKTKMLKFGTSGLRGFVHVMTDKECYINTSGFIRYLIDTDDIKKGANIYIAGDLRPSTGRIKHSVTKAVNETGARACDCGLLPTPVLANFARINDSAAIMVTGSHIPADQNGIKFYKRSEEVLKQDETAILEHIKKARDALRL